MSRKVRIEDIRKLIATLYSECMDSRYSQDDYLNGAGNANFKISFNSIYIQIEEYLEVSISATKQMQIDRFSKELEKITLGNLKVVKTEIKKAIGQQPTVIRIANNYDIYEEVEKAK